MAYIFLDESGDLGFGKKSSRWFVFAIAIVSNPRSLERVIKKVWRQLKEKHKGLGELHASHEQYITRKRVLRMLNEINDLKILCVILNKRKVHLDFQNQKNYLYAYTANALLEQFYSKKIVAEHVQIHLYVDQRDTKRKLKENFIKHLTSSLAKKRIGKFSVELHTSHENKSLQAVDFIAWSVFQKYEHGDFEYYEIFKEKILDEKLLFP